MDNQQVVTQVKRFWTAPKIIFGILGLILFAELIWGLTKLAQRQPSLPTRQTTGLKIQAATGGRLAIVAPQKVYQVGDTIPVSVKISTGGKQTDGADIVMRYDPKVLEATSTSLLRGKVYPDYPQILVDSKKGTIAISGITTAGGKSFNGSGDLAIISFKAKAVGKTVLRADFKRGQTTDSNIIESGTNKDILQKVYNLSLEIK